MAETTPPLECSLRSSEDTRECSWFRKASLRETLFPKVTETHVWRSSALLLAPGTRPLQCRPLESHSRAWLSQATLGSPFRGLTRASSHLPGHHSTGRFCGIAPVSHDVMKLFLDKEGPSLQYLYSGPQNTFAGDLFWKLPNQWKWGQRGRVEGRVKQAKDTKRTGITGTSAVTRLCCMQKWKSSVIHMTRLSQYKSMSPQKIFKRIRSSTFYLESPLCIHILPTWPDRVRPSFSIKTFQIAYFPLNSVQCIHYPTAYGDPY